MVLSIILYYAHRLLQLHYYRHCKSDLFRVVLFEQSVMCVHITNVLNLVEVACHQAVKQITAHVLNTLNGGGGVAVSFLGNAF